MATSKTKKATTTTDKAKVFDVAKPGSSDPETGTKPMVIGHKTMTSDPSMVTSEAKSQSDEQEKVAEEPTIQLSPSKKLTLQPLSVEDKDTSNVTESPEQNKQSSDDGKDTTADIGSESPAEEEQDKQKTAEELEKERQVETDDRELKLRELIKSGEYNVEINESRAFNGKVFLTTFLLSGILLLIILAILIDAEIIDIGVTLPFDVL